MSLRDFALTDELLKQMPKAELHIHIEGSLEHFSKQLIHRFSGPEMFGAWLPRRMYKGRSFSTDQFFCKLL